jgi:hypothetical protein
MIIDLDGDWTSAGRTVTVPGLATDPTASAPVALERRVHLPEGGWSRAWLELDGARWRPQAVVDGVVVASAPGGLAPIVLELAHPVVRPGGACTLEVRLAGLSEVPPADASWLPAVDQWRANCASCLWDSVRLRLTGPARIVRLAPYPQQTAEGWRVHVLTEADGDLHLRIRDGDRVLAEGPGPLDLPAGTPTWPHLLTLEAELRVHGAISDVRSMSLALREVRATGNGIQLNGRPLQLRMISVGWHRWVRDGAPGWDARWFEQHIIARAKALGVNGIRFHLGLPPRRIRDLCDRHGLFIQAEWCCFHGLAADEESLASQWRDWLDQCAAHPSIILVHAWNESSGDEVAKGFRALDRALAGRPTPPLVAHRDLVHLHRYWWSLFENLGLFYDHAGQFDRPVVADEFGGNYLTADGEPGAYPAVAGSLRRFLGWHHDRDERLAFQALANARVAEYWRRLDVAGFSPFCALGSRADGDTWFLGPIADGRPMPVWEALGAAFSPVTALLDLWETTVPPGAVLACPLSVRNDTAAATTAEVILALRRSDGIPAAGHRLTLRLPPHGRAEVEVPLAITNSGVVEATVAGTPARSAWPVRVHAPVVGERLRSAAIATDDPELRRFLQDAGLRLAEAGTADVVVGASTALAAALARGAGGVWLDAGEAHLGEEYPDSPRALEARPEPSLPPPGAWGAWQEVAGGVRVRWRRVAEPESCLHPPPDGSPLWRHLPADAHRLWNGLRGGLVVPAVDWELAGLSRTAARSAWIARGADPAALDAGRCIAYHLAGHWAFAPAPDPEVAEALRRQVRFLAEDAPALAWALDPTPPQMCDAAAQVANADGQAVVLEPLAVAGKDLTRTPIWRAGFGAGRGHLCLSQCLTAGRLDPAYAGAGRWGRRRDPCAQQLVLDLLELALPHGA